MQRIAVTGYASYGDPLKEHGEVVHVPFGSPLPKEIDVAVFSGGEDICPSVYGDRNFASGCNPYRDSHEIEWFEHCIKHKIKMVGICRGMQLFTALTGGKLIQDVANHAGNKHRVYMASTDKEYVVNSLHHQMCAPKNGTYKLLVYANGLSTKYVGSNAAQINLRKVFGSRQREPEALYFPDVNALGVQWHPEMLSKESEGYRLFQTLYKEYIKE